MKNKPISTLALVLALASTAAAAEVIGGAQPVSTVGGQRIATASQPSLQWSTWLPTPVALAITTAPGTPATPAAPLQREPSGRKNPPVMTTAAIPMTPVNPALRAGLSR